MSVRSDIPPTSCGVHWLTKIRPALITPYTVVILAQSLKGTRLEKEAGLCVSGCTETTYCHPLDVGISIYEFEIVNKQNKDSTR